MKQITCFIQVKCKQLVLLYAIMSAFRLYVALTGDSIEVEAVEIKSFEELNHIGRTTQNGMILYQNFMIRMSELGRI